MSCSRTRVLLAATLLLLGAITASQEVSRAWIDQSYGAEPAPHTPNSPVSRFVGKWTNKDFETPGVTRIEIRLDDSGVVVHMWGRCHPKECDWGETTAIPKDRVLSLKWDQKFCAKTQQLKLVSDKSLQLTTHCHFTDNSGRRDYDSREVFAKGLVHDWNDP
jgi:hypothetical protein